MTMMTTTTSSTTTKTSTITTAAPGPLGPPSFSPTAALTLAQGTTLTYYQATPTLALLALVPSAVFAARRGLLEYNVVFFREGVQEICEVEADARRA